MERMFEAGTLSVKDVIDKIDTKKFLLLSQLSHRNFPWRHAKITTLFNSLMKDYPIGSFLFWKVEGENIQKYQFYEFVREYHETKNFSGPKANVGREQEITAILDGRQRLTSLYVGLKGSYADKLPRRHRANTAAYPKRKLYLDLVAPSKNAGFLRQYDFQLLMKEEYDKSTNNGHHWFEVGRIIDMPDPKLVSDDLAKQNIPASSHQFASEALFKLQEVIHRKEPISYWKVH